MSFRVGQKVEYVGGLCVQATGRPVPQPKVPYTISNVYLKRYGFETLEAIELVELPFNGDDRFDPGFNARAFRPLVERKTDISVFTEMLKRWEVPA